MAVLYADRLAEAAQPLVDGLVPDHDVLALGLPDGEAAKNASVANDCWEALGERGFTRSDAVVSFGGGAVTDLAGFVAATWLRGVRVVHVPTTLLGMVDAAVGGKTGINTAAGKNLVGAFHEPAGVLCDLATLATLPREDLVAGLARGRQVRLHRRPADPRAGRGERPRVADRRTPRCCASWSSARSGSRSTSWSADLKETGGAGGHPGREVLNYGHTLAHAIERAEDYSVRHGDAVAIGCVYAAELAGVAGVLDDATVARHHDAFARVGLPTTYAGASFDDLHATMKVDKKSRGSLLRFIVLRDVADPVVLEGPSEDDLRAAYERIGGAR